MIYVFTGDDRGRILQEIKKILGEEYEIFEGAELNLQDIVNICQGMSLFSSERKILIKDLTPARKDEGEEDAPGLDYYAELIKYVNTPHRVVIWETNTSRKKSFLQFKKAKGVKALEFKLNKDDWKRPFEIADLVFSNPKRAIEELRKIEDESDPYLFVGVLTAKLCTRYGYSQGEKEKQALLGLAELDMLMKTTSLQPWRLLESFLLSLSLS